MSRSTNFQKAIDWVTIAYFLVLVFLGWLSIYGASFDIENQTGILDFSQRAGKQFVWIITAILLGGIILLIEYKLFNHLAYIIYGATILLLIITWLLAPEIKGSRSWLVIGPISFQPAELAKVATSLALAKFMSNYNFRLRTLKDLLPLLVIIFIPLSLIILQKETGSALVFMSFFFVFYREGMNGVLLLIGALFIALFVIIIRFGGVLVFNESATLGLLIAIAIILMIQFVYTFFFTQNKKGSSISFLTSILVFTACVFINKHWHPINLDAAAISIVVLTCVYWAVRDIITRHKQYLWIILVSVFSLGFCLTSDYFFESVLQPHQQMRIKVLLNMANDPSGVEYNVNQSKIAIGSGGFWGKGFLNGTQTKLKYVPEQDTDFIFCTIGEEFGFVGSAGVLILYWLLFMRLIKIAERQKETFSRVYAYCVLSILFFHVMINVGMVLGIMPVIGIPLPFFSYGGSSLWAFTILLFILLRLDASRVEIVR